MARIDEVRKNYEDITDRLFSDKEQFTEYLKFAGKFFKLPSAQSMTVFGYNPNAVMVAEYDTWKKFDRYVKRGTSSIAVLDNGGGLKHFFDISQTNGSKIPYQWTLDKDTAAALIEETFENEGQRFNSFGGCVNYLGAEKARENLASVINSLNISQDNRAKFEKSFISMTQYLIAARCELGGDFRYNGKVDLSALDMLNSKAEKEKLCEFVHLTGKSVLLFLEQSINNIIIQRRTINNGRNQTDMVRGGQDVLSRNQNGERQNVQTRSENVRVPAADGLGTDGRGTGSDERGHRALRGEMERVYDGEPPRSDTVTARAPEMGTDTQTGGQRGSGVSGTAAETVREREPAPENVSGDSRVGENAGNDDRQGDNGGHSSDISGLSGESHNIERATYSTNSHNEQAEEHSPAFSVDDIKLIVNNISRISDNLNENYDGEYREFTLANYAFSHSGAEYDLNLSVRDNVSNMLANGGYGFLTEYLQTVYKEAFEGRVLLDEGVIAENTLPIIEEQIEKSERSLNIPDDLDKFYINKESESVTWVYYNPDSSAGGQLVYNHFSFDQLFKALDNDNISEALTHTARTELVDIDDPAFQSRAREFLSDKEDFSFNAEWDRAKLSAIVEPTYSIYQLKSGDDLRDYRFAEISELRDRGLTVDRDNYNKVYSGRLGDGETLDDLYDKFNINRPEDFYGHSMSVSDVVEIRQDGKQTAHYVDGFGFEEIPDFTLDRAKQKADRAEDKDNTDIAEHEANETADFSDIINSVRGGRTAKITEKSAEQDVMIEDARKTKFKNITLQFDNERGYYLTADTSKEVAVVITVFGRNEQAVKDYLAENTEQTALSNTYHIGTVDGKGYFYMEQPFSMSTAPEIRDRCDSYIIAAPSLHYSEDFLNEHNITFIKLDRDIPRDIIQKSTEEIISAMNIAAAKITAEKNPITFGFLGNGITVFDTSKWDNEAKDYLTIAHISDEGLVNYYVDKNSLGADDIALIEKHAARKKQEFTDQWEKLPLEKRYARIFDEATLLPKPQFNVFYADKLSMEETVKKYEHAIIFRDEEFPAAEKTLTAYRVGVFFELFNEDAQTAADLLSLTQTKRSGVPMTGFPAHVYEDYRRKSAMNGYYLKIGDEREIKKILSEVKSKKKEVTKSERSTASKDEDTIFDWSKYTALGAHSAYDRIIREKNTAIDTDVKISLLPKSEDLSDYTLVIGIEPRTENNQLYFAIEYGLRNENTEEITEIGTYFVDTDDVMIAGHSERLPDYETFRAMVEAKATKVIDKIRENARERSPEEIYKGMSDVDRTFFDANAYADILYIEGLVKNARANKLAEQTRLENREKVYAERFGTTLDEFRALVRYHEAELAKQTITVSPDDLKVGDLVRYNGGIWRISKIDGDFSIAFENTDKNDIRSVQSIIGHWKEQFFNSGYEYVSPTELTIDQLREIEQSAKKPKKGETRAETMEESYGEQLNLFGEPMNEVEIPEKNYIGGIDIEQALKKEIISHGTMFRDGKFRIEEYYRTNNGNTKDFEKIIAKEYGIGGHTVEGFDSKIRAVNYDNKGLEITIRLDNDEKTTAHWSWNKIANRIATLIDNGEYITQSDIDERIKHAQFEFSHYEQGSIEYERAEKVLDHYGMLPSPAPDQTIAENAEELVKGDKIRYDGEEWTVGGVGDNYISLKNADGEEKNFYNSPTQKWYDTLNGDGFEFISAAEPETNLDRAKELINDFCEREYDGVGDFSDLTRVPIAYTTDEETDLPINVYADLENKRIISQFNNVTVKVDEYSSLAEMNDVALSELNYDELILDIISYKDTPLQEEEIPQSEEISAPVDIKNLAQLKRALTVGTEFEITSGIRPDIVNQLRQVKYADTVGIYSIRPDAPNSDVSLANNGRGYHLDWGKATDWEFSNGECTAYRKGEEHTPENALFRIKIKPRVLQKQETEIPAQAEISMPKEVTATDFARSMGINVVDMSGESAELTTAPRDTIPVKEPEPKTEKSVILPTDNPITEKLSDIFPLDTARQLYNAFEKSKMADWNSNNAKINRIKKALYDILGSEDQTERAFRIISSALQNAKDFTITDEHLGEGGAKAKFAANIAAIQTLKKIEAERRLATPEEQETLSKYVGWGGLPQAFDGANAKWSSEYEQLKNLLTDDEYRAANASVLNAHYTTPTVISAIYKGLQHLGFKGGNILEPAMGVGNFFGAMPDDIRKNSNLSGVELDSISGRIAKQLYPTADIQVKGFEETDFSDNYFDVAVGNVPFGNVPISDKRYNRENFYIHDYFLAKSLDKIAPNGIMAMITTKGTLDKTSPKVREYLAKRADLIGAIRLPNNAFKSNAGTEVTTDILFFQKREKMAVELPDWCYIGTTRDGVPVNNYFVDHPEMILGTMKQGMEYSLYGNANETACVPIEGANLAEQLEKAVTNLKVNRALQIHTEERAKREGVIPAAADVRNFTFTEVDGMMYFRENNVMTAVVDKDNKPISGKKLERMKALNELRKTFRTILTAQENDCSDVQLQEYQKILNNQYDVFVKKYGYINDSANLQVFGKDDDYNSLCALEVIDEETKKFEKSDFFSKRTVKHYVEIDHVDTPQEAMHVSIDMHGRLDFEYMARLCNKEPQEVIDALKADNLIYLNPNKANSENELEGWEEASEYLSGNVRIKLRAAELAVKDNSEYQRNVAALTAVIPKRIEAGDIAARIGVHWVDVKDYQKFLEETAQARFAEPLRRAINGEYKIGRKGSDRSAAATQIHGTGRMNSLEIFENLLNNRDVVVKDKKIDPETLKEYYVINKKETELAQDKASKMKAAFTRWLWSDPDRREKYVTRYNELFNSLVGRKFDGSHQTFPGMSPYIKLKPHQLDAVARAKFGGNTLLAHCVGAGKSFEMVAATMEKKRIGLINKACVVVPKSLVGQMSAEWLRLYPQARILTASENDFSKDRRQKFIGRCCTGEYDAVIMSYEQFEKIGMSFEYRRDFMQREIDGLTKGINDLESDYRRAREDRGTIKDLERVKKRLEAKLKKLIEDNGKIKDTSLDFEQLGFDSLVVDEAHNYKNGLVVTKMSRVAGVQTTPAQKSEDILMKTQYLNDNYGEKNLIFATGTPVSNSMTELYIMTRYLRPSLLAQAGLQTFDDWASTFGEVVSKAELKPAGDGYRTKKRFAKFNNLPELMSMYKEFADVRTADMLNLPVPEIEGGKPKTLVAHPNDFQKAYMKELAIRSEAVHNGAVEPNVDNMLKITGEARLLGLDARCLNPDAENYPDSKVNMCIDKVVEIYTNTKAQKGVQAIFCDIAVQGDNEQEEQEEESKSKGKGKNKKPKIKQEDEGKFSVYNYIKAELIRRGIPRDEICFAGDANNQKQQNEMRAQLRAGTKRIVIASTSKLGTGANIQNKLVALHNLDIPWKPSDVDPTQRNAS